MDCSGSTYERLVISGYTFLVVFVIGVPFGVFAPLLYKNLTKHGEPIVEETDSWLGPLYQTYKLKYRRYFPLVFLARRLLLARFLSLIPGSSCYQILSITFVLLVFIVIDLIARPYKQYWDRFQFENVADILISTLLLLSFVGLATLRNASKLDYSLVWLILSMNFIVVFCSVSGILILFAFNLWRHPQPPMALQYEPIAA